MQGVTRAPDSSQSPRLQRPRRRAISKKMFAALLLLIAALAFAGVALAIPKLMPLFARYAMARPNARSSHKQPIPQGGGAPIVLAVVLLALAAFWSGLVPPSSLEVRRYYLLALGAAFTMALLGAADDIRPLPAWSRFVIQTVLAALIVFAAPAAWRLFPDFLPATVERALATLTLIWFVNLTNFMDGIDGITVAEGAPAGGALALLAALGLVSAEGGIIAAALAGGLIGFFLYNRHPAKLFLGDVGSLPIGLLIGAALFELAATRSVAAALLIPLYFVADATGTLIKGVAAGKDVLSAHRRHAYQNAVDGGVAVPQVVTRVLHLNLLLVVLALAALLAESALAETAILLAGTAATLVVLRRFRSARA